MERPGTSNVMSAMPSLSTSILKFSIGPTLLHTCSYACGGLFSSFDFLFAAATPTATPSPAPIATPRLRPSARLSVAAPMATPAATPTPMKVAKIPPFILVHPLDHHCGAHAGADAERDQRALFIRTLQLIDHGAEDH